MPTGYTAKIANGTTFQEFALGCARGMGALITMRDEPNDAPIPDEFPADNHHQNQITSDKAEINRISRMTVEEAEEKAKQEHEDALTHYQNSLVEDAALKQKYMSMLEQVEAYQIPSPDHAGFKNFMREQIVSSMDFDCHSDSYQKNIDDLTKKGPLTGEQWKENKISTLESDIAYHNQQNENDQNRAQERTVWVKQLKLSLDI